MTIWDGTYIYINKSANQTFQKLTYNKQKSQKILRPMVCVTTNGYIIDVFGSFEATKNDAKCMRQILECNPEVTETLRQNDVFIFDRGFRDCLEEIKRMGYVTKTPEFIQRNESTQLTTEQGNRSRIVTKTRFVVESRNGHLKNIFTMFAHQWPTICVNSLREDLRIAAAIINKYFQSVVADKGKQELVANAMLTRLTVPNEIHPIIKTHLFRSHKEFFKPIENDFRFPRITLEELSMITLGSYQLTQARSYAHRHKKARMDPEGFEYPCSQGPIDIIEFFFGDLIRSKNITEAVLVKTRMASRFMSGKWHDSYVLADASKNGPDAIISYCCACKHGLRTVGCCSHVATTIFYLAYARHNGGITPVAGHVEHFFDMESSGEDD